MSRIAKRNSRRSSRRLRTEVLEERRLLAAEIEPNDSTGTATALPPGDTLEGRLSSVNDVDFFQVDLIRGDQFSINTQNFNAPVTSPTLPPGLDILDSSGNLLATSDDGKTLAIVAPATGTYLVRVSADNVFGTYTGPYAMRSSHVASGSSTDPTGLAFTQFNNPNLFVDISTTGAALNLIDDQFAFINSTVGNVLIPAGQVGVSNNGLIFEGRGSGTFVNQTLPENAFDAALYAFWDDIDDGAGNVYWQNLQVDGINALVVQWHMRPHFLLTTAPQVTFQLQLFESGPILSRFVYQDVIFGAAGFDNGSSATIGYQFDATTAIQYSFNQPILNNGDVIDLTASGLEPEPNDSQALATDLNDTLGDQFEAQLADAADRDIFSVDGVEGQTLAIAFAGLSESNPNVTLRDEFGNVLAADTSGLGLAAELPADGRYFFELSSSFPEQEGDYVFVADLLDNAESFSELGSTFATANPLTLNPSGNLVASLDSSTDRDLFRFELDDFEVYQFDLQINDSEVITDSGKDLRLYNALGQIVGQSSSGSITTERVAGFAPGTYYLEVLANSPVGDGQYAIAYRSSKEFSLQRDATLHVLEFAGSNEYLGQFQLQSSYAVPEAIPFYEGALQSRYGVYEVETTSARPVDGKERVAQGIGNFGPIQIAGAGAGDAGIRSGNGESIVQALETSVSSLSSLQTNVAAHEFGHAVGLDHERDPESLLSYVGTEQYLPPGQSFPFIFEDNRRPGGDVNNVRDYLDFILQPGAQVAIPESVESSGPVALDSFLREMSVDFESTAIFDTPDQPFDITSGDFNGDGLPDLVVALAGNEGEIAIYLTQADGTLLPLPAQPQIGTLAVGTDPLEIEDVNNDGNDDILWINHPSPMVNLLISNGDGTFAPRRTHTLTGAPQGIEVEDFDGDGNLDIASTIAVRNVIEVNRGAGDGTFGAAEVYVTGQNPHGVATGDFNGDGIPDLAATILDTNELIVYQGDGTGLFESPMTISVGNGPESLVSDDFNNDGIGDVAIIFSGDQTIQTFFGDTQGALTPAQSFDARIAPLNISLDNIDGDPFPDLVVGGADSSLKVLLGSADGTFTRPISIQTGNGEALGVAGDFDGDGVNEMAVTNFLDDTLTIVDTPQRNNELNDRVVVFAAIDQDGDTDEYRLDVTANQRFRFDIDAAEFQYPLDAILEIYGSDGTLLASSDDALDGNTGIFSVDPFIDTTFASDDTVTIRVTGKRITLGNYRLKVTPERAIETVGPTVLAISPENQSTVDAVSQLTFFMDSVIDPSSLTPENIRVMRIGGVIVPGTAIVNPLDSTVVWTADQPLEPGTYQVRLLSGATGITDLAGNPLDGNIASDFSFPARSGNPLQPNSDFVATFNVDVEDTVPATVSGRVIQLRDPYDASRFIVRFDDQLSIVSVETSPFLLREAGADGLLDTSDDLLIELDPNLDSIRSSSSFDLNLYSSGTLDSGIYRLEADLVDAAGNAVQLREIVSVAGTVPEANLFTDAGLTNNGLQGSYFNASLTVDELDLRATQTATGTRVDPQVAFTTDTFGTRADVGITGGTSDFNWDNFTVQWDGFVSIPSDGIRLQTTSDESSRFWVDIDQNGTFDANELFDNGWPNDQMLGSSQITPALTSGSYQVRIQYREGAFENRMFFEWIVPGQALDTAGLIHGPSVTDLSLTAGEHHVTDSASELAITFSAAIDPLTLTPQNVSLLFSQDAVFYDGDDRPVADADGIIAWDPITNQATLEFAEPLAFGYYLLNLNGDSGGITNTAGDLLDGEFLNGNVTGNASPFLRNEQVSGDGIAGGDFIAEFSISREALDVDISPQSISERGGEAVATISRRFTDLNTPLFVQLNVTDDTELRLGARQISFPPGVESVDVPIFAIDDTVVDGDQSVGIIARSTSGIQDGTSFVTVTDFESFDLQLSDDTLFENGDTITLTISRDDVSRSATVNIASSDTSRLVVNPSTLILPAGQANARVTLTGVDNATIDGTQTVSVDVTGNQLTQASIEVDVLDFEQLVLNIDEPAISENGGVATATITRTDASQALVATLTPTSRLSVPDAIGFAVGQLVSDPFSITAIDNQTLDGVQIQTVTASAPGHIDGAADITVTDFEELSFVSPTAIIAENAGIVQMQLRRSDVSGELVASLSSSNPSRLRLPPSANFADGEELSTPFNVIVLDNRVPDGDQTITLTANAFGYQLGLFDIEFTDFEPLTLTRLTNPVTEQSGQVTFQLTRPTPSGDAEVFLDGSVASIFTLPTSVRFSAGATTVGFVGTVIDNNFVSDSQSVTVTADSEEYIASSVTFDIEDNDTPSLTVELDSSNLFEGARPTMARLIRNTRTALDVTVQSSADGFINFPTTISFQPGRSFVEFEISAIDDDLANGRQEIELTFDAPEHPTVMTTVTTVDDEVVDFEFTVPELSLTEGDNDVLSALVLTARPSSELTITLAPSDDTQLTVAPSELTFTPDNWDVAQSVLVGTVDDLIVEQTRNLSVVASVTATEGPFATVPDGILAVELLDDDVPMILVEETDGSTIVTELGLDDSFTIALGSRPATDVTLVVDGSAVPEAVFDPSRLTFTTDNWNQPQTVNVSTPLDFDVDRNSIGSVLIQIDAAASDPAFADVGQRIITAVHIDAILNDLRVRQQDGRLILIDEVSGQTLRSSLLSEPGGGTIQMGSRSESVIIERLQESNTTPITIDTAGGDDTISLADQIQAEIDGGLGFDTVRVLTATLTDESAGGVRLRNIEQIDLSDQASQTVELDSQEVIRITDDRNSLTVTADETDSLILEDGFSFGAPQLVAGIATHTLIKDNATIQLSNGAIWRNPFDRFDVDRNGDVAARDALVTINRLATQDSTLLPTLPEADEFFFDVNADGFATPSDALAIINRLAAANNSAQAESVSDVIRTTREEAAVESMPTDSGTLLSDASDRASWSDAVDQVVEEIDTDWFDGEEESPEKSRLGSDSELSTLS